MNLLTGLFLSILPLSLALNLFQYHLAKRARLKQPESYELSAFMRDMLRGRGLLEVKRVDPANIMIHSPRDMR
jgi:hypothetical protein